MPKNILGSQVDLQLYWMRHDDHVAMEVENWEAAEVHLQCFNNA